MTRIFWTPPKGINLALSRLLRVLLTSLLLAASATAGRLVPETVVCPVCETKCEGGVYASSTTFGSSRDFLRQSSSPFYRTVVSCPNCHYTNFTSKFEGQLSEQTLERLKALQLKSPGSPVEKMEHVALLAVAKGSKSEDVALAWLETAWTVRLTENPLQGLLPRNANELGREILPLDRDVSRLERARQLHKLLPTLDGEQREMASLLAAAHFCNQGEYAFLLAQPELPHDGVREVMAREREFLARAVRSLESAFADGEIEGQEATLTYLVGELHRRLGAYEIARGWYQKALLHPDLPDDLRTWAPEQMALCAPPASTPGQTPWLPTVGLIALLTVLGYGLKSRRR